MCWITLGMKIRKQLYIDFMFGILDKSNAMPPESTIYYHVL
jgi:hypothetical protein